MKKAIKIMSLLMACGVFMFMAYGSGGEDNKKWEPNNKEMFCGNDFTKDDYLANIDMKITAETIFNSDGTYISKKGWGVVGEDSKEEYNNTVGRSGEENYKFEGTWEMIQPTEALKGDGSTQKYKPTYIKFKSNNGTVGYAEILCQKYEVYYYLYLTVMDASGNELYDEGEIKAGMFGGSDLCQNIENKVE